MILTGNWNGETSLQVNWGGTLIPCDWIDNYQAHVTVPAGTAGAVVSVAVVTPAGTSNALTYTYDLVYAQTSALHVAAADALAAGYTCHVMLDGTTTPTAATVFGQIQSFAANPSTTDNDLFPSGYPRDLAVTYQGAPVDTDILEASSARIVVCFALQAALAASAADTTNYVLTWSNAAPATPRTLANIYLASDDFLTSPVNPAYSQVNTTPTVTPGAYLALATPGARDPSGMGLVLPGTATLNMQMEALVSVQTAQSGWSNGDTRIGLGLNPDGDAGGGAINWILTGGNGDVNFLDDGRAWGPAYNALGALAANTWLHLKMKVVGTTVWGEAWLVGTAEPTTWNDTWTFGTRSTVGARLTTPNTNPDNPQPLFRHVRVYAAVTNEPTVTTS